MSNRLFTSGYGTKNTNNLRLWESKPKRGFDLQSFNDQFTFLDPLLSNYVTEMISASSLVQLPPLSRRLRTSCRSF